MSASSDFSEYHAIHQATGDAISAWAAVEQSVESLFVGLTTADMWDAHLIMVSVRSFDARLAICNTLMGRYHKLESFEGWGPLYNKLGRKFSKRSEIAHGSVIQLNEDVVLVPYFTPGLSMKGYVGKDADNPPPLKGLSAKEITERAASFRKLAESVYKFKGAFVAERERLRASRAQEADRRRQPDRNVRSPKAKRSPRPSSVR